MESLKTYLGDVYFYLSNDGTVYDILSYDNGSDCAFKGVKDVTDDKKQVKVPTISVTNGEDKTTVYYLDNYVDDGDEYVKDSTEFKKTDCSCNGDVADKTIGEYYHCLCEEQIKNAIKARPSADYDFFNNRRKVIGIPMFMFDDEDYTVEGTEQISFTEKYFNDIKKEVVEDEAWKAANDKANEFGYELDESTEIVVKPSGETDDHEYVEIAGIKWATMNVGANSITDVGLHFQWGDTQGYTASQVGSGSGQKYFGWEDYKYGDAEMTKYNNTDGKTVLDASDDAAQANWGGNWRMPTIEEFSALGNNVETAWTNDYQGSGISGMICTDSNDSSKELFFPACGTFDEGDVHNINTYGYYWSSSIEGGNVKRAQILSFKNNTVSWRFFGERYIGFCVRPVLDE